jgi:hypothetical protein
MAKARKPPAAPEPPRIGDKVRPGKSEMIYTVGHVSQDGKEVNLYVPDMNLERFRVQSDTLTFVERKPPAKTTKPESVFDAEEVIVRLDAVKRESLKRLDDDIDILKTYLKTQKVPKTIITALEGLTIEQHVSWKKAVERIENLLEE